MAGGGTGGHLFPALALAEEFRRRDKAIEVIFVGSSQGMEKTLVPKYGYKLILLDVEAVKNRKGLGKIKPLLKAFKATLNAMKLLKELKPDGVIGSGAYSSGPVVLAARLLGIKTAILEQNVMPGLTNRVLGKIVHRVYISFEESEGYFPKRKTLLTGNPIRKDVLMAKGHLKKKAKDKFNIFVFGGSQGATAINAAFLDATEYLIDIWNSINVVHQTGKEGYAMAEAAYSRKGLRVELSTFIEDMATKYSESDLVIGRAGATTIAEITAMGLPSILVPYPFASDNHQEANAKTLEKKNAAIMIRQSDLTGSSLAAAIRKLYEDKVEFNKIKQAVQALGRPNAAEDAADDYFDMFEGEA